MLFIDLRRGRMVGRGWRSFRGVYRGKKVILEREYLIYLCYWTSLRTAFLLYTVPCLGQRLTG